MPAMLKKQSITRLIVLWLGICLTIFFFVPTQVLAQEPPGPITPPPPFDPSKLQPGQPLPGEDYPPAPLSYEPPVRVQERPDGIDLDLTFISREPQYNRYWLYYPGGTGHKPRLVPGTENDKRWPDPGEVVTFTAHIVNKGTQPSGSFAYKWSVDGLEVASGVLTGLLPGQTVTTSYPWIWAHRLSGERLLDDHTIRFEVDPADQIAETFESNNQIEDRTNGLSLRMAITPQIYETLDETPVGAAIPYSAEDWLQKQIKAINDALVNSTYYFLPGGATERVRIDDILVTSINPNFTLGFDGGWFMDADYRYVSAYYDPLTDIDWGLVHELSHQIGLIDLYRYNLEPYMIQTLRQDGSVYDQSYWQPNGGIMFGGDTAPHNDHYLYSSHSAAGISSTKGYRRGYYGEYQYDLPPEIWLEVRDEAGYPVEGVNLSLYQRLPLYQGYTEVIDNIPEIVGVTDASGRFLLPNRNVAGPITTRTGHTLADNPFGVIDVVGTGNEFLIKFNQAGDEDFQWLPLTNLNLHYWTFGAPPAQIIFHRWNHPHLPACSKINFSDSFDQNTVDSCWRWIDPGNDGQHSLAVNPGWLRLSLNQGNNDLRPDANINAPRLLQNFEGNFSLTTRLQFDPRYNYQGAGLLIWQDAQNFLRLERARSETQGIIVWFNQNGRLTSFNPASTTATDLYLRIIRIGSLFICQYSETSVNWSHLTTLALPFQPNLAAGLALVNQHQDNPIQVDFDQISVAEPDYQPIYLPLISK